MKSGKGFVNSLFGSRDSNTSNNQLELVNKWNDAIKKGSLSQKRQTEILENADEATQKYFKGLNGKEATLNGLAKATGKVSAGAKAAAIGMGALKTAMNVGISMLISFAASALFNFIITKIDEIVNKTQKIKEAATEAKSAIKDIKSEFDNLKSSTENVGKKFAELAQGVENLGKANQSRGKLSTEDYDEFLDLSNQLAELYPQLTKGYDDNGNAILKLSGNVDTITGALTNLLTVQQKIANHQILEKMPDVWAGYDVDVNEYSKKLENAKRISDVALNAVSQIDNRTEDIFKTRSIGANATYDYELIIEAFKNIKVDLPEHSAKGYGSEGFGSQYAGLEWTWDISDLTDTQIEQLKNELGRLSSEYQDEIFKIQNDIMASNSEISSYINAWLSTEWNFVHLDSSLQSSVKDILINFDWTKAIPNNVDSGNWETVSNWLSQDFLYAIQNINSDEIKQSLSKAFSDTLSFDEIQKLIDTLKNSEGFDENNPLVLYFQAKIDTQNERIEGAKAKLYDEYKDKVNELPDEDLQIASEKLSISDESLLTWDELKQKIQEVKDQEKYASLANKDYADSLAKIKEKTDESLEKSNLFKSAIEKQKMGEYLSYDEVAGLVELDPSIASMARKTADGYSIAIDKLIATDEEYRKSAKSDISEQMNSTSSEIKNWQKKLMELQITKQLLTNKENDIKNQLGNSSSRGQVEALQKQLSDNSSQIKDIDAQIQEAINQLQNGKDLLSALKLIFGELSQSASEIKTMSFSDLSSSYELLNSATEEFNKNGIITLSTLEKIIDTYPELKNTVDQYLRGIISENELIEKLSERYKQDENSYYKYLLVKMGYNEDYVNAALDGNDGIVAYFAKNYEIDLSNFNDYISRKKAIQAAFDSYVAGDISRYFDENGKETAEYLNLPDMAKSGIRSIYNQYLNAMDELEGFGDINAQFQTDLANIREKTQTSLKSANSSSGGSSTDTSKTFNWIEIAIEKVSKAASKLGNIVSNTFKSWTDRNNALKKQIKEVNKEVELQQQAYNAYIQKANSVGLSDYWANKVRNGSIDISVITDKDLADKIDEFKEWYLKMPLYLVTGGGILFNC